MDARPILLLLARTLEECGLEAVLIGNAAAALHGAPVTTLDFDFLIRKTSRNVAKVKEVARKLGGMVLRPYYPASDLLRVTRDDDGLQVDFMGTIHGVRSFERLRSRARAVSLGGHLLLVAHLGDVVQSKRAAGRPRDRAVLEILERTLREQEEGIKAKKVGRPQAGK